MKNLYSKTLAIPSVFDLLFDPYKNYLCYLVFRMKLLIAEFDNLCSESLVIIISGFFLIICPVCTVVFERLFGQQHKLIDLVRKSC